MSELNLDALAKIVQKALALECGDTIELSRNRLGGTELRIVRYPKEMESGGPFTLLSLTLLSLLQLANATKSAYRDQTAGDLAHG